MDVSGSSYLSVTARNIIKSTLTNDDSIREQLKSWRKRLREICNDSSASLLEQIQSDKLSAVERYEEFTADKEKIQLVEETIVDTYEDLRIKNKKVLDEYLDSMEHMFESYRKIEDKIEELEELEKEFISLSCLDSDDGTKEYSTLLTSIQEYIQKKYESSQIAVDFCAFKKHYMIWKMLRSVVLQAHVAQDLLGGPYCSICTTDRVNTTLVPCGHTYCNNCGQKQKSACFICRTTVKERLRIFFT